MTVMSNMLVALDVSLLSGQKEKTHLVHSFSVSAFTLRALVACLLSGQEEGKQHGHAYVSGLAAGHGLPVPLPVPGRIPQLRLVEWELEPVSGQPMPMLCMHVYIYL